MFGRYLPFFPALEPPGLELDVGFLSGRWLSADPAADLASFVDFGLLSTRDAALPALLPVFSFLAILAPPLG